MLAKVIEKLKHLKEKIMAYMSYGKPKKTMPKKKKKKTSAKKKKK